MASESFMAYQRGIISLMTRHTVVIGHCVPETANEEVTTKEASMLGKLPGIEERLARTLCGVASVYGIRRSSGNAILALPVHRASVLSAGDDLDKATGRDDRDALVGVQGQ